MNKTKNELFGPLLAATIHEIKNRFGLLYTDLDALLAALPVTPDQQQQVEAIKSEAQFVGNELVRVLATYKSMGDNFTINVDQQFTIEFLEETTARHSFTFKANQVSTDIDCDEDCSGFFDLGIVTIVMDTLIYNAIKAGSNQLKFTADEDDQFLYIHVHDNGPGFPPSMLGNPVNPSKMSVDKQSTGLGLFFAQQLLAAHQEDNRVGQLILGKSDLLAGAKVTIQLPM